MTSQYTHSTGSSARRVFFALRANAVTCNALADQIAPLRKSHAQWLRWLDASDWHITLKFIGDVEGDTLPALSGCMRSIATQHEPFAINFTKIELFPTRKQPLVLAATANPEQLVGKLIEDLESACCELGLLREFRPWRCHMSLARVLRRAHLALDPVVIDINLHITHLFLLESVVIGERRRYRPVASAPLGRVPIDKRMDGVHPTIM